jgi:hypothetical protein
MGKRGDILRAFSHNMPSSIDVAQVTALNVLLRRWRKKEEEDMYVQLKDIFTDMMPLFRSAMEGGVHLYDRRLIDHYTLIVKVAGFPDYVAEKGAAHVNGHFPARVMDGEGAIDLFVSGWLSCVAAFAAALIADEHPDEEICDCLPGEIAKRPPLQHIATLSKHGDTLCGIALFSDTDAVRPGFIEPLRMYDCASEEDEMKYGIYVGQHRFCGGMLTRLRIAESKDAVVCRNCGLRTPISRDVRTYGDLRSETRGGAVPAVEMSGEMPLAETG